MNIKARLDRLEQQACLDVRTMTDDQLRHISQGLEPDVAAAIRRMTDAELNAVIDMRPADTMAFVAARVAAQKDGRL